MIQQQKNIYVRRDDINLDWLLRRKEFVLCAAVLNNDPIRYNEQEKNVIVSMFSWAL